MSNLGMQSYLSFGLSNEQNLGKMERSENWIRIYGLPILQKRAKKQIRILWSFREGT